jgi:serine/threonine protein kinase
MRQAAAALSYLHSHKPPIIHRDIKSQNMLLTQKCVHLKLADFGNAKSQYKKMTDDDSSGTVTIQRNDMTNESDNIGTEKQQETEMTIMAGTISWMAPEVRGTFEILLHRIQSSA